MHLEREDVRGVFVVMANQLSIELILLHHMIAWILVPKTRHFDFITEKELMLMVVLIQETTMNLLGIIVRQMYEAASSRRLCIPYGMGLTHIFREFGIPLVARPSRSCCPSIHMMTCPYTTWVLEDRWLMGALNIKIASRLRL